MCYLIAKHFEKPGCIAVKTERGKALAALVWQDKNPDTDGDHKRYIEIIRAEYKKRKNDK